MSVRNIGIPGVNPPKMRECSDKDCPFHGNTRIRGKITQGVVQKTLKDKSIHSIR